MWVYIVIDMNHDGVNKQWCNNISVLFVSLFSFCLSCDHVQDILHDAHLGVSALMIASHKGDVAAVELLLDRGAYIEALDDVSSGACTAYCGND